ncbi:MAG: hypothetical protein ACPGU5_03110 [Lishizhenia sp.]
MERYNKIMQFFWLVMGVLLVVVVTFLSIKEGFSKWAGYYFMAILCFLMYFVKKWMMKRMEKHHSWIQEQKEKQN